MVTHKYRKLAQGFVQSQTLSLLTGVFFVFALYFMSQAYPENMASYFVSMPALLIVTVTALARINDIGKKKQGIEWHIRRIGLILAGSGAATLLLSPLSETPKYPSWTGAMLFWGIALTWLTTPNMPPWEKYVFGKASALPYQFPKKDK